MFLQIPVKNQSLVTENEEHLEPGRVVADHGPCTGRLNKRTVGAKEFKTSLNSLLSPSLLRSLAGVLDNGPACMSISASTHLCLEFRLQLLCQTSSSHDSHSCFPRGLYRVFPLACVYFVNLKTFWWERHYHRGKKRHTAVLWQFTG